MSDDDYAKTLEAKSDQINAADLVGREMTLTIKGVSVNTREDQPVSVKVAEDARFFRPSKGMRRVMAALWGSDPQAYVGKRITVYRDADVRFGADMVGGIRISHASGIDGERKVVIPVSRGKVKTYTIKPLPPAHAPQDGAGLAECEAAARQGAEAFRAWWGSDEGRKHRATAQANLDRLKALAAESDAAQDMPLEDDDMEPPL